MQIRRKGYGIRRTVCGAKDESLLKKSKDTGPEDLALVSPQRDVHEHTVSISELKCLK